MTQEVTNFARFYLSFNRLPAAGDREDVKRSLVMQYTNNRTDSLRGMTRGEYNACCAALEQSLQGKAYRQALLEERRYRRSVCLRLMQQLGIDTSSWQRINLFCRDPRIAGKPFSLIDNEELAALAVKLRKIQRRGGIRPTPVARQQKPIITTILKQETYGNN